MPLHLSPLLPPLTLKAQKRRRASLSRLSRLRHKVLFFGFSPRETACCSETAEISRRFRQTAPHLTSGIPFPATDSISLCEGSLCVRRRIVKRGAPDSQLPCLRGALSTSRFHACHRSRCRVGSTFNGVKSPSTCDPVSCRDGGFMSCVTMARAFRRVVVKQLAGG
ncbi:hypothetical protein AAFF_G00221180 [Aldrovandia affinis]|uniref:Uncharacterized protein n=1 Tax=Aldrovandia affinis TaxID=143900 RepID=A0AAD7RG08_9TELE|nr:hypothetical protein AAFF_G00221180 [Aldrovandia affinis]